jgi:hypothetical protein
VARIVAPVADFEGDVAGVTFEAGVGETSDPAALAYFRRHGYGVDGRAPQVPSEDRPVDARDAVGEKVGTPLRDAAVDPDPNDFLPPINAGLADPHGPEVVSPGIHGVEPGPVVAGKVSSTPDVQEAKEEAAAAEVLVDGDAPAVDAPPKTAKKEQWVAYAVSQGADEDEANTKTKADLIAAYAPKTEA